MKKSLIALSVVSLLGLGAFTVQANASDQNAPSNNSIKEITDNSNRGNGEQKQKNSMCNNLTEEQQKLIEKGYNELTQEEKDMYDKYHQKHKKDLSEDELNKYYQIADKVYKYMDEDFKTQVKERREQRKLHREKMQNNINKGNSHGKGRGKNSCK